jgi:STE24 endopeptidase
MRVPLALLGLCLLFAHPAAFAQPQEGGVDPGGRVDLSSLSGEQRSLFEEVAGERLSPCGGAETLSACLEKKDACSTCIARGRSLARLLLKGASREQAENVLDDIDKAQAAAPQQIDLGPAEGRGAKDAPVILVEFADYECPYCGRLEPQLQRVLARHPDWVRHYFLNFPLTQLHENADAAARAAIAARRQGKFWEMHDLLYARQESLSEGIYEGLAKELGLDVARFTADMASKDVADELARDVAEARRLKVDGTPTLFLNGRRYEDLSNEAALEDGLAFEYAQKTGDQSAFLRDPSRRERAKERSFYAHLLELSVLALNLAFLWLFLRSGLSARLRDLVGRRLGGPWGKSAGYLFLFTLLMAVVFLPVEILSSWGFDQRYGLSNQGLAAWLGEWAIGLVISLLGTVLLGGIFFWILRRFPRRWWLVVAVAVIPLAASLSALYPVAIAPLFNDYTPLPQGEVRSRVEALAAEQGIPLEGIYLMDMSRQTSRANAYVTGLGATKRIVFTDTLLANFTPDEIAFVTGHEIGHYVLHHLWIGILVFGAGGFLVLYLLARLTGRILARRGEALGVREAADPASTPLLMLVLAVLSFAGNPVGNAISRELEHRADVYSLEVTGDGEAAALAFEKLGTQNLADPDPALIWKILFADHPTIQERVDFARSWGK